MQPASAHAGTETQREDDKHSGLENLPSKRVGMCDSRCFFDLTRDGVRRAEFHYEKRRSS